MFVRCLNNLKRDHLEIQHPKFENNRRGLIEPVSLLIRNNVRCDIPHTT